MFLDDFKYFYISFINENLRNILLSFLIFGKHEKMTKIDYIKNLTSFVNIDDNFKILFDNDNTIPHINLKRERQNFIFSPDIKSWFNNDNNNYNKNNSNNKEEEYIVKEFFIKFLDKNKINISFYSKIKNSSELLDKKRKKEKHYVCDCLKKNSKNDSNDGKTEDSFEIIKKGFSKDKLVIKEHLSFENLKKIMKEFRVNEKLIKLIMNYFEAYTLKNSINFKDFNELIFNDKNSNVSANKKSILFKMILTIYNQKSELKGEQLKNFFEIENNECKLEEVINQKKFESLDDPIIKTGIEEYAEYMENLRYLPYVRYNLETEDQELKKKIINFMLNKKSSEDYLKENFDKCNKFYPINKKFWDSLTNNKSEENDQQKIELTIKNSLIAIKDKIYYIKKNNEEKNQKQKSENEIKEINEITTQKKQDNIEKNNINKNEIKTESGMKGDKKAGSNEKGETKNGEKIITESIEEKNKKCIKGKLKDGMKYGEDFIIICGEIFEKIFKYFEFDILVELDKTYIFYEPKREEEKKTKVAQKENKKEEKKEEEEIKDISPQELEIDTDNNCLRKKENKDKRIKEYIVDFYPIKILQLNFGEILNKIKVIYLEEERKRIEELKKKSKEDRKNLEKEERLKIKNQEKIKNMYLDKMEKVENLYNKKLIEKEFAIEKIDILKKKYFDFRKKEEEIKVPKNKFFEIFVKKLNNFLFDKTTFISKISKLITNQEIKYHLINYTPNLNITNFDLIFYSYEKKNLMIKEEENLTQIKDDFILIIIDKKNQEGKTGLSILEENEKSLIIENNIKNITSELDDFENELKEELKKTKEEKEAKEKEKKEKERLQKEKQEKEEKERRKVIEKKIKPPYGIPNFGNTCYFNSVNQIILNLPLMEKLFTEKNIKYMINKENKFGHKGKLVSYFMPLYELYPYQIEDYVKNLKSQVGKLKDTFNNREQQDAHEYLNFILEGLHEELNLKSSKIYIEDNDDNFKFNNEEELGNIAWANNLRRNVSFIDSIFMFQLRSNLTCKKCKTTKYNFESNYVFNLPLSLCKLVTVHITLFRLPFKYKVYYDKINKEFKKFKNKEENKDKNITEILCDYYSKELNFEQKKDQTVKISFEFDFEREKCIGDLIKLMRNISLLELEPENIVTINKVNSDIKECQIKHYSELFAYSHDKNKIIKNDVILDKYVDVNDKVYLYIYEVLNTNGFCLINKQYIEKLESNLFSYQITNKKSISKLDDFNNKIPNAKYFIKEKKNGKKSENKESKATKDNKNNNNNNNNNKNNDNNDNNENNDNNDNNDNNNIPDTENNSINKKEQFENKIIILSANDNSYFINHFETELKNKQIISEIIIPIVHYKRDLEDRWQTIFQQFYFSKINELPLQLLILNNHNSSKISSKELYNYIYDYNSLYMTHPNKPRDKFWFNKDKNDVNYKKCYPFIVRIVKQNKKFPLPYKCSKCHWFNFCIGCVLSPDEKNIKLESDDIIFVDWCNEFIKEEIDSQYFDSKNISSEEITLSIESAVKNDKNNRYQSIQDCFDLFFEKEDLEDPLSCRNCGGPQNFTKNYEINKLPYVLILSLKRFKYNENNNFKLRQLITYPLNNYKLKDKIYNLFGVIYHYGGINSGHYTCAIRKDKKWILCDDNRITEIEEKRVMTSNAYILFYIANDSINTYSYYNCMKSLLQHMITDKSRKNQNFKDINFFKGEPVRVKSKGIGYVVEDYIEDFIIEKEPKKDSKDKEAMKKDSKDEKKIKKDSKDKEEIKKDSKDEKEIKKDSKDEKEIKKDSKDEKEIKKDSKDENEIKKDSEDKNEIKENEIKIKEEIKKDSEDKNEIKENEIKIKEEIKKEEIKKEEIKNDGINNNLKVKKDGKVKVKFESIKEVQSVDKNIVEKLILIDEQKKDN